MNKRQLVTRLDNVLKRQGFVRKGATWNRRSGAFVQVFELTIGRFGNDYTVALGVWADDLGARIWDKSFADLVPEPFCTVRRRIGEFLNPPRDFWWEADDQDSIIQVEELVLLHGLPFVERMCSKKEMETWLTEQGVARKRNPPAAIALALLKIDRGDVSEGCIILSELAKTTIGDWKSSIELLVEHLCHADTRSGTD